MEKPAITSVPIHELLARRWSPRALDPNRHLTQEQIMALCEAARWAPSCFGDQPWRIVVCARQTDPGAWQSALACLAEKNQSWARHAPVLMLVAAASTFSRNGKPNRWGQYDTGAASENLCLQAAALGLAAHQMGGFDAANVAQALGIPEDFTCMAMIAVGYLGDETRLPEDLRETEVSPRARAALGERFFAGRWGQPIEGKKGLIDTAL